MCVYRAGRRSFCAHVFPLAFLPLAVVFLSGHFSSSGPGVGGGGGGEEGGLAGVGTVGGGGVRRGGWPG